MNNDDKLKIILKNVVNRCNGKLFYKIELNGSICDIHKEGTKYIIESPHYGYCIDVDTIENVKFGDDVFYATFKAGHCGELGINLIKDMSPLDIEIELLKYTPLKLNFAEIEQSLAEEQRYSNHWYDQYPSVDDLI